MSTADDYYGGADLGLDFGVGYGPGERDSVITSRAMREAGADFDDDPEEMHNAVLTVKRRQRREARA